ncbi:MAG TPA: DUF1501 domain-containing protein [Terriglobia bacterium]|nr:DUF1501 domain-containing protein [Terriglobia bacterium]
MNRRDLLRTGLYGIGIGATGLARVPALFAQTAQALTGGPSASPRILVVLELSGGNDGLNTLVPFGDDAYYRQRPRIGIRASNVRKIDEHFGFSSGMAGFERLYKDGKLAIVHGCGYANPSLSHFTSMAYWHTAAPNRGDEYGWAGRTADAMAPKAPPNFLVNIDARQSLAVRSRLHTPLVFDDPRKFAREGFYQQRGVFAQDVDTGSVSNPSQRFLQDVARSAKSASATVKEAWAKYKSPVDYGINGLDLPKVVSLIDAGMPARLYYVAYRNNAFDTHVFQGDLHQRLLTYTSDAVAAFLVDLERIGRADDVALMIFSEFGRRVPENTSLGTDHGTANLMFAAGKKVKGGHYGQVPSLTRLDEGDNLIHTTDFRQVYATMISGWLGFKDTASILNGSFQTFDMFS